MPVPEDACVCSHVDSICGIFFRRRTGYTLYIGPENDIRGGIHTAYGCAVLYRRRRFYELFGYNQKNHGLLRSADRKASRRPCAGEHLTFHHHGGTFRFQSCRRCNGSKDAGPRDGKKRSAQGLFLRDNGLFRSDNAADPTGNRNDPLWFYRTDLHRKTVYCRNRSRVVDLCSYDGTYGRHFQEEKLQNAR